MPTQLSCEVLPEETLRLIKVLPGGGKDLGQVDLDELQKALIWRISDLQVVVAEEILVFGETCQRDIGRRVELVVRLVDHHPAGTEYVACQEVYPPGNEDRNGVQLAALQQQLGNLGVF
jgi:hypothetical protein